MCNMLIFIKKIIINKKIFEKILKADEKHEVISSCKPSDEDIFFVYDLYEKSYQKK